MATLAAGVLLWFCLVRESQVGNGEFLKSGRQILNSIGVIIAVDIHLGRQIKNLGRRIKDFFLSWTGKIRRSPGQNKSHVRLNDLNDLEENFFSFESRDNIPTNA